MHAMDISVRKISGLATLGCHFDKQEIWEESAIIKLGKTDIQRAHVLSTFSSKGHLRPLSFKYLKGEQTQERELRERFYVESPSILQDKQPRHPGVKHQGGGEGKGRWVLGYFLNASFPNIISLLLPSWLL